LAEVEVKEIDDQGRIVIPVEWRGKLKTKKVLMKLKKNGGVIEIFPYNSLDLTKYFDSIEADIQTPLSNWHSLRKELRSRKRE